MKNKTVPYIYNQNHRVKIGDYLVCQNEINRRHPLHQHDFYEFEYIAEGEGVHIINNERHLIKRGDLLFYHTYGFSWL